ncbi:MAG: hypothetical protein P1U86_18065 [Verrucomicrobiales bacterium]|nr:hypothetical protein [Verrucomicrobiales bacterium]
MHSLFSAFLLTLSIFICTKAATAGDSFFITVTDSASGRPVPLVELRTTNQVRYHTDNLGVVTIDDPELLGEEVFFFVESHGYTFPADAFGMVGTRIELTPGGKAELKLTRINIAERIYRVTGGGRFVHSEKAGLEIPPFRRGLRAGVLGCDSVLNAIYKGKLFWIWGDTNRQSYPLGNFHSTGATSEIPWDPEEGIDLHYFENEESFVQPMAKMPGEGPTWLTGLTVLTDKDGKEHLGAMYQKVKGYLELYETGLCEFDDETGTFQKHFAFDAGEERKHLGHPFPYEDEAGKQWIVYADPLPTMKIPASYEAWLDPAQYEPIETKSSFVDSDGIEVIPHRGTITWNDYRKRWVMIFCETKIGTKVSTPSLLGEIWYAESPSPFGPWDRCVKVITHDRYSLYNPKQHPYFAAEGGKVIYFEGTYTTTFSNAPVPTPRYDYNQILYRLDLGDERLREAQSW